MRNVYTIGDALLDIIFKNDKPIDAKPGGSLLNSAVSLGRLGVSVAMIGNLANDPAGNIIRKFLNKNHVNTEFINLCDDAKSKIALAFLNEKNNAEYSFYKDKMLNRNTKIPKIKENDIVLFGSSYGIRDEVRKNLMTFLKYAKSQKAIIIYDPNCRAANTNTLTSIRSHIEENISLANIVRGSNEDFKNIYGLNSSEKVFEWIKSFSDTHLIYTSNKNRVNLNTNSYTVNFKVPQIKVVSTIGAGDTFNAAIIYFLLKESIYCNQLNNLSPDFWNKLIKTAVFFSQEVCMRYENYIPVELATKYSL